MKPKEKAKELVSKFSPFAHWDDGSSNNDFNSINCALIAVEEILNSNPTWFVDQMKSTHKFWEDVRTELNAL